MGVHYPLLQHIAQNWHTHRPLTPRHVWGTPHRRRSRRPWDL